MVEATQLACTRYNQLYVPPRWVLSISVEHPLSSQEVAFACELEGLEWLVQVSWLTYKVSSHLLILLKAAGITELQK